LPHPEGRAKGQFAELKLLFPEKKACDAVILTRARTSPRHFEESNLTPALTMGCDDTSLAALASAGLTADSSTFPAARFRPDSQFVKIGSSETSAARRWSRRGASSFS
jgi:hypothetical protein